MRTLEEIKAEIVASNPSRFYESNGEIFEQTDAEFEEAIQKRAEMVFEQEQYAEEIAVATSQRQALLERLGITEEEARLLLA